MHDANKDLRVLRTKESIRNALIELIEEKGFEAITVKDITTRAKINRSTFYSHYEDKYNLMEICEKEIMSEMAHIAKQNFPEVISELEAHSHIVKPLNIAAAIFEFIDKNSAFMKAALSPKGNLSFQETLKDFMWRTIFEDHPDAFIKKEDLLVPGEYLASYISSAHIGLIQQWLHNGKRESPQEMAKILSIITFNGPFFAAGIKK